MKPIIFSGEMVRVILEGRKTQTRRVIKPQPYHSTDCGSHWYWQGTNRWNGISIGQPTTEKLVGELLKQDVCLAWPHPRCPYGKPGGLLWVRETWRTSRQYDDAKPSEIPEDSSLWYSADWMSVRRLGQKPGKVRPSIFMPRWASRIMLRIVDVRAERVQDISPTDCIDEGIEQAVVLLVNPPTPERIKEAAELIARDRFRELWDSIVKRGFSWKINPWVWVIEFKVEEPDVRS